MIYRSEIIVLGSGFAGTLTALGLNAIGKDVILLERSSHPRFAIGESSTPLASLLLQKICKEYDLPELLPLCKYGSWKKEHPDVMCGLKRGFSFFKHQKGQHFSSKNNTNALMVAASPSDEVGDTHWLRADTDFLFLQQAIKKGVRYFDHAEIESVCDQDGWMLDVRCENQQLSFECDFLIDASGGNSRLIDYLGLDSETDKMRMQSYAVFGHFRNMKPWKESLTTSEIASHPFDCDSSALHHVFDDGWMWQLRFDNGITSAGLLSRSRFEANRSPDEIWQGTLGQYPSIAVQFKEAMPVQPLIRTNRLQRRLNKAAGENWALLPHSFGFVDPLLSPGHAHSLFGVERLLRIFSQFKHQKDRTPALREYEAALKREVQFLDEMIATCYSTFPRFEIFCDYSMYYFTGAIWHEERILKGLARPNDEFLFSHDVDFRNTISKVNSDLDRIVDNNLLSPSGAKDFARRVAGDIAPWNVAGLCDPQKQNMYHYEAGGAG